MTEASNEIIDPSEPLFLACKNNNPELVEQHLKNGIVVTNEILKYVFDEMNIPIIKIFINNSVDLSSIQINEYKWYNFAVELEHLGLDKNALLIMALAKIDKETEKIN